MPLTGPAGMLDRRRVWWGPLVAIAIALSALFVLPSLADASTSLPPGFQEQTVFSGLSLPTAVRFAPAPDTRVFVAEKRGRIQEYDSVDDASPTQVINLQQEVYNFSDRGLLGLAVDPGFPGRPYLYALYTRDAVPGGDVPRWGTPPYEDEDCTPGGVASTHCTVTGRLVKITIDPVTNVATNTATLIDDWCQEYLSHSVGDLRFGSDGQLYASGGDGADYDDGDYGQGTPANLCGDPIFKDQSDKVLPTSEGGALRSLDLMTPNDPTSLDGAIIRIDPDTGAASAGNPVTTGDANAKRIVAYGLRNPFRFTFKPGSHEIWLGDVGWGDYEEVNRLDDPTAPGATAKNFGWPCYEGDGLPGSKPQKVYKFYGISLCEQLYAQGPSAVVPPVYAYFHDHPDTDASACALVRAGNVTAFKAGSSVTGMTFYENPATGGYGAGYEGGLFFADYARGCIWYMPPDDENEPDPSQIRTFAEGASYPVDLQLGPGGDLYYASIGAGDVRRISHSDLAVSLSADKTYGAAPLNVALTANVTGANGHALTYAWDLDGDGVYGDFGETGATVNRSFAQQKPGVKVRVRVTDTTANPDVVTTSSPVLIAPGDVTPPTAHIDTPSPSLAWTVGQSIGFSGGGTDADEPGGATDDARTSWELILQHCPGGCHQHYVRSYAGVAGGTFTGVQHEYPSHLTLRLTVTDEYGLTDTTSIDLNPQTAKLSVLSDPAGLSAAVNLESGVTPVTATLMKGATVTVATPQNQVLGGKTYTFTGWSDGGDRVHSVTVGADTTLTASFESDTTPPETLIGSGPVGAVNATTVAFGFSSEPGATFECRLDGGAWGGCVSPKEYSGLAEGAHAFEVRASDAAGNVDGSPASRQFSVALPTTAPLPFVALPGSMPPAAAPATPATPASPKVRRGPSVKVGARGIASLPVTCPSARPCAATVTLRPAGGGAVLGRGGVKLAARRKGVVRVALTPAARRTLTRRKRLDVIRTVVLRTAGKPATTDLVRFTLLRAR